MRESEIVYEAGRAWVHADTKRQLYTVYTHSTSRASFALNADGLSIAKAYADYLKEHHERQV